MALSTAAQRRMTLRDVHAHLTWLGEKPTDERAALMAQHPALRGR